MSSTRRSLLTPVVAAVLAIAFAASAIDIVEVVGPSMEPTHVGGERLFVNRLHYGIPIPFSTGYIMHWSTPKKGDIVVYSQPTDGQLAMKRVWAAGNAAVTLENDRLSSEGITASVSPRAIGALRDLQRVPEDHILTLGDNRLASMDSRHYGPISMNALLGRVVQWK